MKNEDKQISIKNTKLRYQRMLPMDERTKRKWAAVEALTIGRGGEYVVNEATGISRTTIRKGICELSAQEETGETVNPNRLRAEGGGRKALTDLSPSLLADLHIILEPITLGSPMKNLKWNSKSTYSISDELAVKGYKIGPRTVSKLMKEENYSLQSNSKSNEGGDHPDRDEQFEYINNLIRKFTKTKQPIISVDCKKKELIGNFFNKGQNWQLKGKPIKVNVYDFVDIGEGKAIPYGVYDISNNEGWVSVGTTHDTSEFAGETIYRWWKNLGEKKYINTAKKLLILADGGGSNSSRSRLWKIAVQNLANQLKMPIYVSHYPPGTSKWNKIEHRMFSYISISWRGRPLVSYKIVVSLIANTTTPEGLVLNAELDDTSYEIGKKISKKEYEKINIHKSKFKPEWNYCIKPK